MTLKVAEVVECTIALQEVNIEGNEERKTTYPLSQMFDGSFNNPLMGSPIPAFGAMGYAFGFSFTISVFAAKGAQGGHRDVLGCLRQ